MKIKSKLKVRQIVNENVVLLPSKDNDRTTRLLSLNPTSLFLWEHLQGKDFSEEDAVQLLMDNYNVEKERVIADVKTCVQQREDADVFE